MVAAGSRPRGATRARIAALSAGAVLVLASCSGTSGSGAPAASTSSTGASTSAGAMAAGGTRTAPTSGSGASVSTGDTLSFTGEGLTPDQATQLQTVVDQGQQPWRLDQVLVAKAFVLNRFGWKDVEAALAFPGTVQVTNRAGGGVVTLQLRQPVHGGPTGVWVVDSGVRAD